MDSIQGPNELFLLNDVDIGYAENVEIEEDNGIEEHIEIGKVEEKENYSDDGQDDQEEEEEYPADEQDDQEDGNEIGEVDEMEEDTSEGRFDVEAEIAFRKMQTIMNLIELGAPVISLTEFCDKYGALSEQLFPNDKNDFADLFVNVEFTSIANRFEVVNKDVLKLFRNFADINIQKYQNLVEIDKLSQSLKQEMEEAVVDDGEEDVIVLDSDAEEGGPPVDVDDEFIVVD
ncbi:hypothetical protein B9Z55_025245 [Caenorhabditis nigoni]|uniref:Uncharacterized protein n=1 Tax=Caenorhabditis nigoni TaxID=1611254 RepID=A0A2G5SXZ6_9PELO|nr:hypothetical protein B9Z55_025245 [Caenorhabditis nigoni]